LTTGVSVGTPAAAVSGTQLEAVNLATGKLRWEVDHLNSKKPSNPLGGGTMTSTGLVWTNSGKTLQAYNELNGKLLWTSPPLAGQSVSSPITYETGGKQYVIILVGSTSDLYAFSL
jgi:outer membrane protein assembly factor BamB